MNRSGLIATKLGNSSFYTADGSSKHVTILKVEDCIVSRVKTVEKDGYSAVQLASIDTGKDIKNTKKPLRKKFYLKKMVFKIGNH